VEEEEDEDVEEEEDDDDSNDDERKEMNTFAFGFDDEPSSSSEENEVDLENPNPYASEPIPAGGARDKDALTEREALIADREQSMVKRETGLTRWLLVIVTLFCLGAAALIAIYFLGIGPFEDDEGGGNTSQSNRDAFAPTTAPISPVPNVTANATTTSAEPSAAPVASLGDLEEFEILTSYLAVVSSGKAINVTAQSLTPNLITLMNFLAPRVMLEIVDLNDGARRQLAVQTVKYPTSIDSISEIGMCEKQTQCALTLVLTPSPIFLFRLPLRS
jgi:hypothetical protein